MDSKFINVPGCSTEWPETKPENFFEKLGRKEGSCCDNGPPKGLYEFLSIPSGSTKLNKYNRNNISYRFKRSLLRHKMRHFDVNEETEENLKFINMDHALARCKRQCKKKTFKTLPSILKLAKEHTAISCTIDRIWFLALEEEFNKTYFKELSDLLEKDSNDSEVLPPCYDLYNWTLCYDIHMTKVVILGERPYIRSGLSHGLAYSVNPGAPIPKSLANIFAELSDDMPGFERPKHGCLYGWADQGVLLLNMCLTVKKGKPNSHLGKGWENLTDAVIKFINENCSNVVFMLWGMKAKEKSKLISEDKHLILKSPHPSHHGFRGSKPFSKANEFLHSKDIRGIKWNFLPEY